eukprot:Hpha_TRINITY_DN16092_c0_g1::TRINITY_DN16092_c0_g1_i1::g.117457::m.117457
MGCGGSSPATEPTNDRREASRTGHAKGTEPALLSDTSSERSTQGGKEALYAPTSTLSSSVPPSRCRPKIMRDDPGRSPHGTSPSGMGTRVESVEELLGKSIHDSPKRLPMLTSPIPSRTSLGNLCGGPGGVTAAELAMLTDNIMADSFSVDNGPSRRGSVLSVSSGVGGRKKKAGGKRLKQRSDSRASLRHSFAKVVPGGSLSASSPPPTTADKLDALDMSGMMQTSVPQSSGASLSRATDSGRWRSFELGELGEEDEEGGDGDDLSPDAATPPPNLSVSYFNDLKKHASTEYAVLTISEYIPPLEERIFKWLLGQCEVKTPDDSPNITERMMPVPLSREHLEIHNTICDEEVPTVGRRHKKGGSANDGMVMPPSASHQFQRGRHSSNASLTSNRSAKSNKSANRKLPGSPSNRALARKPPKSPRDAPGQTSPDATNFLDLN